MNKKALEHYLRTPGYLQYEEAVLLFFVAEKCKNSLEIGSFLGKSSGVIASACKHLTCVDPFDWKPEGELKDCKPAIQEELQDIKGYFHYHMREFNNYIAMINTFDRLYPLTLDSDFIYIDASHEYEDVKRDIHLSLNMEPTYLALHDYTDPSWPGVREAATELLGYGWEYMSGRLAVWRIR